MPHAKLSVELPSGAWIREVSTDNPDAIFKVIAAIPGQDSGVGQVEINATNTDEILEAIKAHLEIMELDVLEKYEDRSLVQFRTKKPLLLYAARDSGVPLETPFRIQDGVAEWRVTAPHDHLSKLGSQLENYGLDYSVQYLRETEFDTLLTDRQEKVLTEAVERGYYNTPRETSLTELADSLGIAKSTCSEILHRAEEKVVKEFVDRVQTSFES